MSDQIRLLLADDHAVVRSGLRMLLQAQPGMIIVGEAETGQEAIRRVAELSPDAVLMDINLGGGMDGIETAIALKGRGAHRVVFMSGYEKERLQKRIGRDYSPTALLFPKPIRMSDIDELDRVFREGA